MTSELYRFTGDTTGPMTAARPPRMRQATLPVARQSPGLARQVARDALMSWQLTHLTDTAILLISELVTNAALHRRAPGLRLIGLGCPGETTATMIHGGSCAYRGGSQLAAAVGFLRAHRGHVSLVTLDVGANDPNSCITHPSPAKIMPCLGKSFMGTRANLSTIMARLRAAAGRARIIGMNYYLPELVEWRNGFIGEALARVAELAAVGYNNLLAKVYGEYGARTANVFGAFHTSDFGADVTVPGYGRLPRNVAAICQWTWQCAAPPRGPNQHANQAGYAVIARAFLLAGAA